MAERNLLANASLNGFEHGYAFAQGNDYQVQVSPGVRVDGWVVGTIGVGIFVFSSANSGVKDFKIFQDQSSVIGGVRLCVDSTGGQIYHTLGTLSAGQKCTIKWSDILDHFHNNSTPDSYTIRIDVNARGTLSDVGREESYLTQSVWRDHTIEFTSSRTAEYFVSFLGKNSPLKRGAMISNVSAMVASALSATDIRQVTKPLQLVYDSGTGLAQSTVAWVFRVLNSGGESLEGQTAIFRLNGDNIHFAGMKPGESWQAPIRGEQVELETGAVLLRGNGGAHSLSVQVGTFSTPRPFPITITGGVANADWKLGLAQGDADSVAEVGGSLPFVLALSYKGQASDKQTLQVVEKTADNQSLFVAVPTEITTQSDGQASLSLVAARPGTATITITHVNSNAQVVLKLEVLEAGARKYLLELTKPVNRKLAINRQDLVQIRVLDALHRTPVATAIKVTAKVDVGHDSAKMTFHAKDAVTQDGIASFLATATALGTSNVVFQTDPTSQAASLPVAFTSQAGVSETQLRVSPEQLELLPDSFDDKQQVHVFFEPVPPEIPPFIDFAVVDTSSSLRVRQGNLQKLAGQLKVGDGGGTVLTGFQVGAESPGKTLSVKFSVDNDAAGVRPCTLNVKIGGGAASVKLLPSGVATKMAPLIVDWNALITLSGCYVLVDSQQAGVPVEFHLIEDKAGLAEFAHARDVSEKSRRIVKTKSGGRSALPDIQTGNQPGGFQVDVYLDGNAHILGSFHFSIEQPLKAQLVTFSDDLFSHLLPGKPFKADYVTVYADLKGRQPLHGGTVQFDLDDTGKTGSHFILDGEKLVLQATAPIDLHGQALLPEIRLGETAGSFSVKATVSMNGNPLITQLKPYTIATS
ncbi:hypothetical protein ACPRNU_06110 [Chromobacterium vaccinii]|uniref:hypothetical protein n=1 Tax=Chromobacterium vaccinii TaxID=1108595 RepID=UPI003C70F80E